MLARKQELNTQLQQLIDALLLAVSLWLADVLMIIRHLPVRPTVHDRSIPELSIGLDLKILLLNTLAILSGLGASGAPSWRGQHSLDIFGQNIELEVYQVARLSIS